MLVCRVLGPIEILEDGGSAPPELLWRKNLALLVYLARSPKRTRSRDHLVGLLWGEKPESAARHSLNEAIRVLRKHVGESGLESEGGQVRLDPSALHLDVDVFEAKVEEASWAEAAALVSGDFMEGFGVPGCSEFEEWLYGERVALRERAVTALVNRAASLLDQGEIREAAATARRALALDATSETAARAAMRSLAIAGDRAAALEVYDSLIARLDEEIGIEPDEQTQALAERVRRERTWRLPAGAIGAAAPGAESRRVPLVGRETELEQLVDGWAACRARRRASLAVVEGDPGTGKTRLVEELAARARLDGAALAEVRAVEADQAEAWSGALGLAGGLSLDLPGLDEMATAARAFFCSEVPAWAERFGAKPGSELAWPPGRSFTEVVRRLAAQQPVFLLVDDAHWLDRDSLLAISAMMRDLENAPVFVVLSLAPYPERVELEELRARVGRELAGVSFRLASLSAETLRSLARWALPSYDEVELDRVTRRIATDSAGLPLLAVELLHAVALGLDLRATGGAWPEPLRTLDQTLPAELPDAVAAAVRVGFRRLSRDAQTVLAAASILGDRVDAARLGRATALKADALAAALDELEWQRWLSAEPRGYSFVARVVRDVVARDMLTPGQRQRILAAVDS
jgi:DNA-binding SARP family transcriptional activator